MKVLNVGKKLIPAVFAISAMTGAANAANIKKPENNTKNITTVEKSPEEKSVSWKDIILYTAIGAFGGAAGATAVLTLKNKKIQISKDDYFDDKFSEESEKINEYMFKLLAEAIDNRPYYVNMNEFIEQTYNFASLYPSRLEPLFMAARTLSDDRLDDAQAEMLAQYFVLKATCTADEWEIANIFPFLDKYDNDYNEIVNELVSRVNAVETVDEVDNTDRTEEANTNNENAIAESGDVNDAETKPKNNLTFKDVGGQNDAIRALKKSILYPIKYPAAFKYNSINHGFVLYGPPGTGKTLIAEALANETKAHFIKLNGNELSSKWVGESEENWRNVFEDARKNQPSIIFIDEFDAVASKRGMGDTHGDKVLNQILGLISDVEKNNESIYIIATTNRLDKIDEAFLRSGRLGKHIELKPPQNPEDVKQILKIHLNKYSVDENLNIDTVSKQLFDIKSTGADIAYIVSTAYENAMNRNLIYEKMDNDSFTDEDMQNVKITQIDIKNAISEFNKKDKKIPIGFKHV